MSAPARRRHIKDSIITLSSSIILRTPPALIIEYSPETCTHKLREKNQHEEHVKSSEGAWRGTKAKLWLRDNQQYGNLATLATLQFYR